MIFGALIERDDIAAQAGLVGRFFLNRVHHRTPGRLRIGSAHARSHRRVHALSHVLDAHQHIQLEIDALHFLGMRLGVIARLHVIMLWSAELPQTVEADVMVRQNQSVRRDERSRSAVVESDRRFLQMIEPRLRRVEVVSLLQEIARRVIEQPHPLVRDCTGSNEQESENKCLLHRASHVVPFMLAMIFATSM